MSNFYHGDIVSLKSFSSEKFTVVNKKDDGERCKGRRIKVLKTDNTTYHIEKDHLKLII